MTTFAAGFLLCSAFLVINPAQAAPHAAPIPIKVAGGIFDMVYDSTGKLLYMTTGKSDILRYDMTTHEFLAPLAIIGSLQGLDISADGTRLAVADAQSGDGKVWVDIVTLATGKAKRIYASAGSIAAGTFDTAFSGSSAVVVSGALPPGYSGAGVPMYVADLSTNVMTQVTGANQAYVTEDTVVRASADHAVVAYTAGDISNGPWGTVDPASAKLGLFGATNWFTYDISVAPKGKYYAVPTYYGTFVFNHAGLGLETLGTYAQTYYTSVVFDTRRPFILYQTRANTSHIDIYNLSTAQMVDTIDTGVPVPSSGDGSFKAGTLRIAGDNSYLFMNTGKGAIAITLH